jgi:hypothetical protein
MMATMVLAAAASGMLVTRRGRYKSIAVFGVTTATLGLLLLSRMTVTTSNAAISAYMMVLGLGLGVTLPIFPLAVHNAVDVSRTGMATAAIQFVRSLGGALGAAVFGAVMANAYEPAFRSALPSDVAARTPPEVLNALRNPQMLMDPGVTSALPSGASLTSLAPVATAVRTALTASLHDVFLWATLLVGLGIFFTIRLVDIPLRTTNRRQT